MHLTQRDIGEIGPACKPHDTVLRATGKVVIQGSLSEPNEWKTIKPENGKPVISNGPFTHEAEQAGAFFIIEANDIDEATAVASKHAAVNYGEHIGFGIDVRKCESFD